MPAGGADARGVRRAGAARSASGRRGLQPGPVAPILADGPRPHSPALSPLSAAGKFIPESNLGARLLRDRGGVGAGGSPEIQKLGAPVPQPAAEKPSTCSPEPPHIEEPVGTPATPHTLAWAPLTRG